jgi:PAS domain S-box-containing protein
MRNNGPVTQREYMLPPGTTLVSTTDLQSHITYCNPAFVETSGFSRDELIGQPHNLVRHPDMPAEAYRDMWATLQAGQPWTALVKNRRKNGDHYWVRANVTPVLEGGRVTGYMSVRTARSVARSRPPRRCTPPCAPKPPLAAWCTPCSRAMCGWPAWVQPSPAWRSPASAPG